MKKFIYLILFFIGLIISSVTSYAQDVKIYTVRDTIFWDDFPNEIFWGFYKVDMKNKTIQSHFFSFTDEDSYPNITNLFEDKIERKFVVRSKTKIKIPKIKGHRHRVKRSFFDFATPGSNRIRKEPSQIFYIRNNTFKRKKIRNYLNNRLYYLDTILTKKFNLTNHKKQI